METTNLVMYHLLNIYKHFSYLNKIELGTTSLHYLVYLINSILFFHNINRPITERIPKRVTK